MGQRHNALLALAGALRARGLSEQEILATLRVRNAERCETPLDEREVSRIAHDIGAKPLVAPAIRAPISPLPQWPDLPAEAAFYGLAGAIARKDRASHRG
jgi:hypothetical protein